MNLKTRIIAALKAKLAEFGIYILTDKQIEELLKVIDIEKLKDLNIM